MNQNTLAVIAVLGRRVGHVLVATADADGLPHVAVAGEVAAEGADRLLVGGWFCPGTLANLQQNEHIAVIVWDASADTGHQVLGRVERIEDMAVLDGYAPQVEQGHPMPQIERQLVVRVETILQFTRVPHVDQIESAASPA